MMAARTRVVSNRDGETWSTSGYYKGKFMGSANVENKREKI